MGQHSPIVWLELGIPVLSACVFQECKLGLPPSLSNCEVAADEAQERVRKVGFGWKAEDMGAEPLSQLSTTPQSPSPASPHCFPHCFSLSLSPPPCIGPGKLPLPGML